MAYLSVDDFLLGIQGDAVDLELPGLGTVRVRSLTTAEVGQIRATTDDDIKISVLAVRVAMVQPQLDDTMLEALETAKPGVIQRIGRRILEVSGMIEEAEKKVGIGS